MFASAFQHPAFRRYVMASFLANVGAEMLAIAVGWQIFALTGRAFDLGMVGLVQFVPAVALTLAAGNAADRRDRTLIVTLTTSIMALCAAALCIMVPLGSTTAIYAVLFGIGIARTFESPAAQALVPGLVPSEQLANALTWSSTTWQVSTIAGPALGGVLYGLGGATVVYGSCAVVLVASAVCAFSLPRQPRPILDEAADLDRVLAGFRFIRAHRVIFEALTLDLFAVVLGGATALLPLFADKILHVGPWGFGILRSAPAIGAALMALVLARFPLAHKAGTKMLWCVAMFGAATIVFGLSETFIISLFALVTLGASDMVSVVVRSTVVQLRTPDDMRGRVSAVNAICIAASNDLGGLESGLAAAWLGAMPAVVIGGIGTLIVTAIYAFGSLKTVDKLE